jgi:hypothetical protein
LQELYAFKGPEAVRVDTWKSVQWDVLTAAGFYTLPRHDNHGYLTYVTMLSGMKLWSLLKLKRGCTDSALLFGRQLQVATSDTAYRELCEQDNLCLVRGTVL